MEGEIPLVVDLDGTLLRTDLLIETGMAFVRETPLRVFEPLHWLTRGKVALKERLAAKTDIDVALLPYEPAVLDFITAERKRGRRVVLATASHHTLAVRVAAHLGLFDDILASEGTTNLSAHAKRDALVDRFGEHGFDYVGNSRDDLPVWKVARRALVVNASPGIERAARAVGNVACVIRNADRSAAKDWTQALRLHQWIKNLLVFVPLLAAHQAGHLPSLFAAVAAFLCFGLCASSVYILNDLLDLRDDRQHPRKRYRPFAAGRLSLHAGLASFPILILLAFALALWLLPLAFAVGLATYYALTLAYSLTLKRRMVIDVMTLAGLYTLRIIVGALATGIPLSFWLLAFSMFLFLSLAMVKRYTELQQARKRGSHGKAKGRGYYPGDLEMIASLGAASGYMAVMVLALYINDTRTAQLYRHPEVIWIACPLLLTWISRTWMLAHRGAMHDDPVVFAVSDRASQVIVALCALVLWAAT